MTDEQKSNLNVEQLDKMASRLGTDLFNIKKQLDEEKARTAQLVKERDEQLKLQEEQVKRFEEMERQMNQMKAEKTAGFNASYNKEVKPFIDTLREHGKCDARFTESVDQYEQMLKEDMDNALMDKRSMANFQVIRAAASAHQMRSSEIERYFQDAKAREAENAEWIEKYNKREKDFEEEKQKSAATLEEKEKMLNDLKEQLRKLQEEHQITETNINNVKSHFTNNATQNNDTATQGEHSSSSSSSSSIPPTPQTSTTPVTTSAIAPPVTTTIQAAASTDSHYHSGFRTLFDFTPKTRDSWIHRAH